MKHIFIEKEEPLLRAKKTFAVIFGVVFLFVTFKMVSTGIKDAEANSALNDNPPPEGIVSIQNNTLVGVANPFEPVSVRKIDVVVTGYSSTVWQTDDTPFITASGKWVKDGIIANNMLPFGTLVRMPEVYGDKIFVVEDRMNARKSNYHFDVWFNEYLEAKNFGVKRTYIEILED